MTCYTACVAIGHAGTQTGTGVLRLLQRLQCRTRTPPRLVSMQPKLHATDSIPLRKTSGLQQRAYNGVAPDSRMFCESGACHMQVHPGVPSLLGCDMDLPRKLYPDKITRKTLQTSPEVARRATGVV